MGRCPLTNADSSNDRYRDAPTRLPEDRPFPRFSRPRPQYPYNWLQVLGTTETPDIDQGVRHQFHPVVTLLDVLETEEQPLEFVLPRKRPLDSLP